MTITNATLTIKSTPNEDNNEFFFPLAHQLNFKKHAKLAWRQLGHFLVYNFWKIMTCGIAFI